jgi:hypothetical protein
LGNGIVKLEINLENIGILKNHSKILVTGPPRSGTTIAAMIIANVLKYKFIDESWYNGSNQELFAWFLNHKRNLVIQNTAFFRDIHLLNLNIVLVRRNRDDIIDSFKNSEKFFSHSIEGMFDGFNDDAKNVILTHFGHKSGCIPDILYKHFEKHNKDYYEINYDCLRKHELFIKKEVRRKKFTHIKQVKVDPNYLEHEVMVSEI